MDRHELNRWLAAKVMGAGERLQDGSPPDYSGDLAACRGVEEAVAEMGFLPCDTFGSSTDPALRLYLEALCDALDVGPEELAYRSTKGWYAAASVLRLITADPLTRCRAIHAALSPYLGEA